MYKKLTYTILALSLLIGSLHIGVQYLGATNSVKVSRTGVLLDLDFSNNNEAATPVVYDNSGKGNHATAANAQTCTDSGCDFTVAGGDYMTGTGTGAFTSASITMYYKFIPTLGVYNESYQVLLDGVVNARYGIHKQVGAQSHKLAILLGNTTVESIAATTYAPYWKVNEENILIVRGTSGNTDVFLNGTNILNNDNTAWSPTAVATYTVGAGYPGTSNFEGKMISFKMWDRQLTDLEVNTLSKDRKMYSTTINRNDLVAYWNMDANDINGTQYLDKSGKGNHATSTGSPTIGKGKKREALDLNGTSQRLEVLSDDSLNFGTGNFTISAWIKLDDVALTQHAGIIEKGDNSEVAGEWVFQILSDVSSNYINFRTGAQSRISGNTTVTKGVWHHVVVTRTGTTMYGYVDGVLDDTGSGASDNLTNTETVRIGWRSPVYDGYFPGLIDEVHIWKHVLTTKQVKKLYSLGNSITVNGPTRSLLGYWSMNDESINGTSLLDMGGKSYHGTIYGAGAGNVATTTGGMVNQALDFDGTNGYVILPTAMNPAIALAQPISVAYWFKTDTTSAGCAMMGYLDGVNQFQFLMGSGQLSIRIGQTDGTTNETGTPADVYNDNKWHYLLWTYDGVSTANLYVDNILKATDSTTPDEFFTASINANIGAVGDSIDGDGTSKFDGLIDEVRIYTHVLGTAEVANAYESSRRTYIQ